MGQLHRVDPNLSVILMSTVGTPGGAVEAIRRGAEDYIVKPLDVGSVTQKIARFQRLLALNHTPKAQGSEEQKTEIRQPFANGSHTIRELVSKGIHAAHKKASILLSGECGVGKDMLARAIHNAGPRASGPYFLIDCRSLGHVLPGHHQFVPDLPASSVSQANLGRMLNTTVGGTLFLNEVGELPPVVQAKLVQAIATLGRRCESGDGSTQLFPHILSSTSHSPAELRRKWLREDLYSRISEVVLHVPPLRDRHEDIVPLIEYFMTRLGQRYGRHFTLSWSSLDSLVHYSFPGNVRELESILERAVALSFQTPLRITGAYLQPFLTTQPTPSTETSALYQALDLHHVEKLTIERALMFAKGNQTKAAALLGISRSGLYLKLKRLSGATKEALA